MSGIEQLLESEFAVRLGWAVIHSLWLGLVIGAVVAGVLKMLRKVDARVRYAVAYLGLLVFALGLPFTAVFGGGAETTANQNSVSAKHELVVSPPVVEMQLGVSSGETNLADPGRVEPAVAIERGVTEERATGRLPGATLEAAPSSEIPHGNEPLGSGAIALVWMSGVFLLGLWHLGGYAQVRSYTKRGLRPVPEDLGGTFKRLAEQLRVSTPVGLWVSEKVKTPSLVGGIKPVILLPLRVITKLSPGELRAVIAHELAHVRRFDHWFNLVQVAAETLLFFHPVAWWMGRRIRQEREICCDDIALSACAERTELAGALLHLAELEIASSPKLAATATGQSRGALLARICRMLGKPQPARSGSRLGGVFSGVFLLALSAACLMAASDQAEDKTGKPATHLAAGLKVSVKEHEGIWELSRKIERDRVFLYEVKSLWKCEGFCQILADLAGEGRPVDELLDTLAKENKLSLTRVRNEVGEHYLFYRQSPEDALKDLVRLIESEEEEVRRSALHTPPITFDLRMVDVLQPHLFEGGRGSAARAVLSSYVGVVPTALALPQDKALDYLKIEAADGDRSAAATGLGRVGGPGSVELLKELVTDEEKAVRLAAVQALRLLKSPEALAAIELAADDEDTDIRAAVAEAFSWFDADPAAEGAIKLTGDEDVAVRAAAVRELAWFGEKVMAALAETLWDENQEVRVATVGSLGRIGGDESIALLEVALQDENQFVREGASASFGKLGGTRTIEALARTAEGENVNARWSMVGALMELGGDEAFELLVKLVDDPDYEVRRRAVYGLGSFPGEMALPVLKRVARERKLSTFQDAVAFSLGEIGGEESVEMLTGMLEDNRDDSHWGVRKQVAYSLAGIGTDDAIARIGKMLEKEDGPDERGLKMAARRGMINALSGCGNTTAVPLLEREMKTEDRQTRHEAIGALARLGGEGVIDLLIEHSEVRPEDKDAVFQALRDYQYGNPRVQKLFTNRSA